MTNKDNNKNDQFAIFMDALRTAIKLAIEDMGVANVAVNGAIIARINMPIEDEETSPERVN